MLSVSLSHIFQEVWTGTFGPSHSPIKCQCCPHIETSQLICYANQLTGLYMTTTLVFNELISYQYLEIYVSFDG